MRSSKVDDNEEEQIGAKPVSRLVKLDKHKLKQSEVYKEVIKEALEFDCEIDDPKDPFAENPQTTRNEDTVDS